VPTGWSKLGAVPQIPGLGLASPVAFAPGGKDGGDAVVLGIVPKAAANSTLLSQAFITAAGSLPAKEAVQSQGGIQGYRYRNVKLQGFARPVTVYVAPTTAGVATLACLSTPAGASTFAPTCDATANTMQLVSGKSFPVGPSQDYAKTVGGVLGTLKGAAKAGQGKLGAATTPNAQAAAARQLGAAYAKAAKALGGLALSPADTLANAKLAGALQATAAAYGTAAKAADKRDKGAFSKASKAVVAGQRSVTAALAGLKSAGYNVTS
jgi:hypothetical protein